MVKQCYNILLYINTIITLKPIKIYLIKNFKICDKDFHNCNHFYGIKIMSYKVSILYTYIMLSLMLIFCIRNYSMAINSTSL